MVFRLMVQSHGGGRAATVRIRELFAQYFANLIDRIHKRCPQRNRERIIELIETWSTSDRSTSPGYIAHEKLGETSNEAIAEAAVTEGLFERVPGGYRYIHDEVFDYAHARGLVNDLVTALSRPDCQALYLVDSALNNGSTFGSVARAIELLSDKYPTLLERFATMLTSELHNRPRTDRVSYISLGKLRGITGVLCRVEKGSLLDPAKDELPIFRIPGLPDGSQWRLSSPLPHDVSDNPFDEERIWRMVRFAAGSEPDKDAYPFRPKSLTRYLCP